MEREPMKTANIAEATANFFALLAEVEAGEEVIITRRGKPVARIVPAPAATPPMFDLAALRAFVRRSLAERARPWPTYAHKTCCDLTGHLSCRAGRVGGLLRRAYRTHSPTPPTGHSVPSAAAFLPLEPPPGHGKNGIFLEYHRRSGSSY